MEVAALAGLLGLGYIVTRLSNTTEENNALPPPPISIKKATQMREAFVDDAGAVQVPRAFNSVKGGSAKGANQELGLMYATPGGQTYPSELSPGPHGNAFDYANRGTKLEGFEPSPSPLDSSTPQVQMNANGVEENATYVDGDYIVSPLSGQKINSKDFKHSNMTPFYGGRVRQNVGSSANTGILDSYTGSGTTIIAKKEVETMFDTANTPFGNPFGMEDNTDFVQSRINTPRSRAGEKPFEPVRVGPAVGEKFGSTGKGGFNQFEVNQTMINNIRRTDDLRTADKPKLTYDKPVIPGSHFIGEAMADAGEVRKYRPDTFFIDESGERYIGAFASDAQRETARPVQVMKHTVRPETSVEYTGVAASQAFGETYVTGSYRTPMAQQYGGAGYRNADGTAYYTSDTDAPEADYGRSSIEMRPNERSATGERTMALNLAPADTGALTVQYTDTSRPTRREETSGNIRQAGVATGYANGAPAVTVWDPNDVARTTVKETTIHWDRYGPAAPADGPTRLKVYDPDDIARPTQKAQISAKSEYFGAGNSANRDFTSHDSAYNMRTNPIKEQIAKGRRPIAGNGNVAVFTGEKMGVTYKKLDADSVNDRSNAVNRVNSIPTGVADLGQVQYRVPLKLDISSERNGRDVVAAVENNPLHQSLFKNAQHDERLLQEMLADM
jgi:hypothetical protein